jgi:acetyl/propionyl-CoA carboxylase alpha subunit
LKEDPILYHFSIANGKMNDYAKEVGKVLDELLNKGITVVSNVTDALSAQIKGLDPENAEGIRKHSQFLSSQLSTPQPSALPSFSVYQSSPPELLFSPLASMPIKSSSSSAHPSINSIPLAQSTSSSPSSFPPPVSYGDRKRKRKIKKKKRRRKRKKKRKEKEILNSKMKKRKKKINQKIKEEG